jgi:hypothetical protein
MLSAVGTDLDVKFRLLIPAAAPTKMTCKVRRYTAPVKMECTVLPLRYPIFQRRKEKIENIVKKRKKKNRGK